MSPTHHTKKNEEIHIQNTSFTRETTQERHLVNGDTGSSLSKKPLKMSISSTDDGYIVLLIEQKQVCQVKWRDHYSTRQRVSEHIK